MCDGLSVAKGLGLMYVRAPKELNQRKPAFEAIRRHQSAARSAKFKVVEVWRYVSFDLSKCEQPHQSGHEDSSAGGVFPPRLLSPTAVLSCFRA